MVRPSKRGSPMTRIVPAGVVISTVTTGSSLRSSMISKLKSDADHTDKVYATGG